MSSPTMCLVFLFPFFCFLFILFLLFPSISIDDMGATSGGFFFWIFLFLSLSPNGFLLCDHGLDLWDRLMCEFNQSINICRSAWNPSVIFLRQDTQRHVYSASGGLRAYACRTEWCHSWFRLQPMAQRPRPSCPWVDQRVSFSTLGRVIPHTHFTPIAMDVSQLVIWREGMAGVFTTTNTRITTDPP